MENVNSGVQDQLFNHFGDARPSWQKCTIWLHFDNDSTETAGTS